MRIVDIWPRAGEEQLAPAVFFQTRQRVVCVVGLGSSEPSPADHASCPVALTRLLVGNERLEPHRLRSFPVAVAVAIVGNTGVRAAAGPRQDEQPLVLFDEG